MHLLEILLHPLCFEAEMKSQERMTVIVMTTTLHASQVYSDPYNVMRSVAFVPIIPQSFSTREVIGEESDIDYHSTQGSDSPRKDLDTQKESNSVKKCPVSEETSSTTPDDHDHEVSNTTA